MDSHAIVLGSSGLVGNLLLKILLESKQYHSVTVFVRRQLEIQHPKLRQIITDFKDFKHLEKDIEGDILFSCLGSTKKKTPKKEDYVFVDKVIPDTFAEITSKKGLKQFHLVSAIGANSDSSIFYNRLKGELEDSIKEKKIPSINIYQPSLIKGKRKEFRFGESVFTFFFKLLDILLAGSLKKYKSINALDIAKAMYNVSLINKKGVYTFTSDKIKELA